MTLPAPAPTLGQALRDAARRRGDAIFCIDGDRSVEYRELDASADRVARGLLGLGLAPGDRIAVLMLNQLEWVQLFFGAARIGVAVVGMSVRYRDSEARAMVTDGRVKAVFTAASHEGHDFVAMFERLAPELPGLEHVICVGGDDDSRGLHELLPEDAGEAALAKAAASVRGDDLAMIIYTSGTTGRPKGAGLTHRSMLASAHAQAEHMRYGPDDLIQMPTPLNHVGGITCGILTMMAGGGTVDLVAEFKAPVVLQRMAKHPPTIVAGVPTMMTLLLMQSQGLDVDFSGVRLVFVGGSNVDATLLEQLQSKMPNATAMNLYGLSESSGAIVISPWNCSQQDLVATIGRPIGGAEVRVLDKQRRPVPAGAVGELAFRGCGVIPGYVGAAAAGSDAFTPDGWLLTGDLGEVDARGFITLRGRAKDMYIQGGFNVYPAEIEAYLAQHPDVVLAAGIGVPDPVMGEVGRYYIVARPGSALTESQLRAWCAEGLADYKVPRQIVFRESLPLTPAGKIHKAALRTEGG
ncbi:MAG: AMP-binding protein [Burkholderiaceae bacterium]